MPTNTVTKIISRNRRIQLASTICFNIQHNSCITFLSRCFHQENVDIGTFSLGQLETLLGHVGIRFQNGQTDELQASLAGLKTQPVVRINHVQPVRIFDESPVKARD